MASRTVSLTRSQQSLRTASSVAYRYATALVGICASHISEASAGSGKLSARADLTAEGGQIRIETPILIGEGGS